MTTPKMKIEVWTDIMCPYCYIGKAHYDRALAQFEHADEVELIIKSFQLSTDLPGNGNGYPVEEYLVNKAGYPKENILQMFDSIERLAASTGLKCNLRNSVAANTLDAHRLIKLATTHGLGSEVMYQISKAYFEDAKDYSDIELLVSIGTNAGLKESEIREMLNSDKFKNEVAQDIKEAHSLNIDTVPTFLFERKYAIIGSEPVSAFLDTLNKAYNSWKSANQSNADIETTKGKSCTANGICEI